MLCVAGDGRHTEDLQLRRLQRQEERHPVVLGRDDEVGVEDDLLRRLGSGARRRGEQDQADSESTHESPHDHLPIRVANVS